MQYYVTFINGSLSGRKLVLPDAGLSLGNGDVDLIVNLEPGALNFVLMPEDGYVRVSEGIAIWIDGKKTTSTELPLNKVIDAAGLCFTISDHSDYNVSVIPDRQDAVRRNFQWLDDPLKLIGIISFFLVVVGISFISVSYRDVLRENKSEQVIADFINTNGVATQHKSLHFNWDRKNVLSITGYCQRQTDLKYIQEWLIKHGIQYNVKTQCVDQLTENIKYLLTQSGYSNFKILEGKHPGELVLHGDFQDGPAWREITGQLNNFEGLSSWHVSVSKFNNLALLDAVKKAGVLGKVSIVKDDNGIIVNGVLSESEITALKNNIFDIDKFEKQKITFQNVKSLNLDENFFSSKIVSVGGNKLSAYIELADKTRLEQGARIKNGFIIAKIDPASGIDVYKDNEILHFSLNI